LIFFEQKDWRRFVVILRSIYILPQTVHYKIVLLPPCSFGDEAYTFDFSADKSDGEIIVGHVHPPPKNQEQHIVGLLGPRACISFEINELDGLRGNTTREVAAHSARTRGPLESRSLAGNHNPNT